MVFWTSWSFSRHYIKVHNTVGQSNVIVLYRILHVG